MKGLTPFPRDEIETKIQDPSNSKAKFNFSEASNFFVTTQETLTGAIAGETSIML